MLKNSFFQEITNLLQFLREKFQTPAYNATDQTCPFLKKLIWGLVQNFFSLKLNQNRDAAEPSELLQLLSIKLNGGGAVLNEHFKLENGECRRKRVLGQCRRRW